jgi:hypothetical protein
MLVLSITATGRSSRLRSLGTPRPVAAIAGNLERPRRTILLKSKPPLSHVFGLYR